MWQPFQIIQEIIQISTSYCKDCGHADALTLELKMRNVCQFTDYCIQCFFLSSSSIALVMCRNDQSNSLYNLRKIWIKVVFPLPTLRLEQKRHESNYTQQASGSGILFTSNAVIPLSLHTTKFHSVGKFHIFPLY